MSPSYDNRETWLLKSLPALRKLLTGAGAPEFPLPLISMGLPSKGALSGKRIGECWTEKSSASEKRCTIFLSPLLSDPVYILATLVHELIHAAVGNKAGHGPAFKRVALGVGLEGKMRATVAGPVLKSKLLLLSQRLGPFPHDALKHFKSPIKKQTTRQRLYVCDRCGQKMRIASDTFKAIHMTLIDDKPCGGEFIKQEPK